MSRARPTLDVPLPAIAELGASVPDHDARRDPRPILRSTHAITLGGARRRRAASPHGAPRVRLALQHAVIALAGFGALHGCSSRMHGAQPDLPARPTLGAPIDRIGRPLTGNALIGPIAPGDTTDRRKEAYNRAAPADWPQFAADIERTLGLYDGFDRTCGNQWLADRGAPPALRYRLLATTLADDRLWIDSTAAACTQYLAVERAALGALNSPKPTSRDCGGRTPTSNAIAVFRSLLIRGTTTGTDDGLDHDDKTPSTADFPFLVAP